MTTKSREDKRNIMQRIKKWSELTVREADSEFGGFSQVLNHRRSFSKPHLVFTERGKQFSFSFVMERCSGFFPVQHLTPNIQSDIVWKVKINNKNAWILTRTESSAPWWYRPSLGRSWLWCTFLSRRRQGASRSRTRCPDTIYREAPSVLWSSARVRIHVFNRFTCWRLKPGCTLGLGQGPQW